MKLFWISLFIFTSGIFSYCQSLDPAYLSYIEAYHQTAVRQQKSHGIPASIILAQGLLESGAGKSRLAVEANNHFGIKCHDWTKDKIYHDDDQRQECFRKYRHASESFEDHSLFLVNRPRYKSLFQLKPTDYVAWAYGLKNAGYATDPNYAQKIINLIEKYDLHAYDTSQKRRSIPDKNDPETIDTPERAIYKSNFIRIIVATENDSYASIAEEFNISEKRLRRYNDVGEETELHAGHIVYLSKKKKRAACSNNIHVVQPGETLYGISQIYGIRLISLYKLNGLSFDQGIYIGQILKLR